MYKIPINIKLIMLMCGQMKYIWTISVFPLFWYFHLVTILHFSNYRTIQVTKEGFFQKKKEKRNYTQIRQGKMASHRLILSCEY